MATLNLPDGCRTAVWRTLQARLKADATLDGADVSLVFLDGDPEATRQLSTLNGPALRVVPTLGNQSWFDEGSTQAALVVFVEAFLPTPDVEDLFNLQEALEAALNSLDDTSFQADLVAAGATTGLVLFTQPLNPARGREGEDTVYRADGQFVVEVRRPLL